MSATTRPPITQTVAAEAPGTVNRFGGRLGSPWLLIVALGVGVFVGGFDQTFVVPVLGDMLRDLGIRVDQFGQTSWILNGYLLGYIVAMPLMGRIADVYGHFRVIIISLLIFMAGSVLVAFSTDIVTLTLARMVTALGGGALVPVSLAITAERLPVRRRPLGLASISVLDDMSNLAGPLWGTLIGVWIGWRGLFWMNIALGLPVMLALLVLARGVHRPRTGAVDWTGGGLLAFTLATLTVALSDDRADPRPLAITLSLYGAALLGLAAFVLWERRAANPLIDVRIFRNARLSAAMLASLLEGGALIVALVNVPLMADQLWDLRGAGPGLTLARLVLFMIAGGVAGGLLAPIIGYRWTAMAGMALAAAGLLGIRAWPLEPNEAQKWAALAVAGFGFTLGDGPIFATVANAVEAGRRASVTAMLQVFQTTGMAIGVSLLGAEGFGRFKERGSELDLFDPEYFAKLKVIEHQTFDQIFLVAALLALLALVACWGLEARRGNGRQLLGDIEVSEKGRSHR